MSDPVGAFVSKSRAMTASNCSSVSKTVKSSSGKKFEGKTRRPNRFTTNGFIAHILPPFRRAAFARRRGRSRCKSKRPATQDLRARFFVATLRTSGYRALRVQLIHARSRHRCADELLGGDPAGALVASGDATVRTVSDAR